MSGRYMKLPAGHYTLMVPSGHGPAGVHRENGDVRLDRRGGRTSFEVPADERVYFWWRGPTEPPGVRIVGPSSRPSLTGERERRSRVSDRRREPRGIDRRVPDRAPDRTQERIA